MQGILQAREVRPEASVPCEPMFESKNTFADRIASAVDLVVDLATLGEYGLEPLPADGRCELDGQRAGWEALATPRRGSCRGPITAGGATPGFGYASQLGARADRRAHARS